MPGAARRARHSHQRRLFHAHLEQLLPAVRAKEPAVPERDLVAVAVQNPTWSTARLAPGVLVLDRAGARLWRAGLDGAASLHTELGPGWTVRLDHGVLRLQREDRHHVAVVVAAVGLDLWVLRGGDPQQSDRALRHRVAEALERALGPTPDVAPSVAIDRVGPASPHEVIMGGLGTLGALAFAAIYFVADLRLRWTPEPLFSGVAAALLLLAGGWLWLPYQRGRDGRVALYPDRLVHLQDRLVVLPWSAVRGFDDRPSSWVTLDCDPPLAIPTVDEVTRTAVLAALDAVGLVRRA